MPALERFALSALGRPPATVTNRTVTVIAASTDAFNSAFPTITSGAMTANVWKTLVSVSSAGVLDLASLSPVDNTARTVDFRIVIDGTTVYTGSEATSFQRWFVGAGIVTLNASGVVTAVASQHLVFNSSLSIDARSTITETDKLRLTYLYRTN